MKLNVYGLNKALNKVKKGGNWISIRDRYTNDETNEKYACMDRRIPRYGCRSMTIYFDDIDPYRFYHDMEHPMIKVKFADPSHEPVFFGPEHVKEIMDFVSPLWEQDHDVEINIHCWAGKSRSQAVAYYLNIYFNLMLDHDVDAFIENNQRNITDKIHFNCEVLKVFSQVCG